MTVNSLSLIINIINRFMFPKCGTPGFVAPEIMAINKRYEKYGP